MNKPTAITFFAGAGGACAGLEQAGFEVVWANEFNPLIADIWQLNHQGSTLDRRSILEIPIDEIPSADLHWYSPPCIEYSNAKTSKTGSTDEEDTAIAQKIAKIIKAKKPRWVVIENVEGYLRPNPSGRQTSWQIIAAAAIDVGYQSIQHQTVNAADYGAPTTRKRMIAIFGPEPVILPKTHTSKAADVGQQQLFGPSLMAWVGWLEAIADLIPNLKPTTLTISQRPKVAELYPDGHPPLLIQRTGFGMRNPEKNRAGPQIKESHEPCWTLTASQGCDGKANKNGIPSFRSPLTILMPGGTAYRGDVATMARIMGFPAGYSWGRYPAIAARGVGNAVAVPVARAIGLALLTIRVFKSN